MKFFLKTNELNSKNMNEQKDAQLKELQTRIKKLGVRNQEKRLVTRSGLNLPNLIKIQE